MARLRRSYTDADKAHASGVNKEWQATRKRMAEHQAAIIKAVKDSQSATNQTEDEDQ